MYNKKVLKEATQKLNSAKAPKKTKDIIVDPRGQWDHPGQVTRIPSNTITMQGVPYPVLGIPDRGAPVMMMPGQYYEFPDDVEYVDEYPQMKKGGGLKSKKYTKSLAGKNELFAEHPLFKKQKLGKKRIYNPNAKHYAEGGELPKAQLGKGMTVNVSPFSLNANQTQLASNVFGEYAPEALLNFTTPLGGSKDTRFSSTLGLTAGLPYTGPFVPSVNADWHWKYRPSALNAGAFAPSVHTDLTAGWDPTQGFNTTLLANPRWEFRNKQPGAYRQPRWPAGAWQAYVGPAGGWNFRQHGFAPKDQQSQMSEKAMGNAGLSYGATAGFEMRPSKKTPLRVGIDASLMEQPGKKEAEKAFNPETDFGKIAFGLTPMVNVKAIYPLGAGYGKKDKNADIKNIKEKDDLIFNNDNQDLADTSGQNIPIRNKKDKEKENQEEVLNYPGGFPPFFSEDGNNGSPIGYLPGYEPESGRMVSEAYTKNRYAPEIASNYQDGGVNRTKLNSEEEEQFQKFYNTLPDNLMDDDPSYDIRGYWDSEGRPESFNYDQPKEEDGYYHGYSINSNTGEYLKAPTHPTFQHAVDEDRKIGYRPLTNVYGRNIATENPALIEPEEQSFLRNTEGPANYIEADLSPEEIQEYAKGGYIIEDISVPELNQAQQGGELYTYNNTNYKKANGKWYKEINGEYVPLTKGDVAQRSAILDKQAHKLSPYEIQERARRQAGVSKYDPLMQKAIPSETTKKVAQDYMGAKDLKEVDQRVQRAATRKNYEEPGYVYKTMTDQQILNNLSPELKKQAQELVKNKTFKTFAEAARDVLIAKEEQRVTALTTKYVMDPLTGKMHNSKEAGPWNNYNDGAIQSADWFWTLPILGTEAGLSALTSDIPALAGRIGSTNVLNNPVTTRVLGSDLLGAADLATKYGTVDKLTRLGTYAKTLQYAPKAVSSIYNLGTDLYARQGMKNPFNVSEINTRLSKNLANLGSMAYDTFLDYGPSSKLMNVLKLGKYVPKTAEGNDIVAGYKTLKNFGSLLKREEGGGTNDEYLELDLSPEEIEEYRNAGYIVEDLNED